MTKTEIRDSVKSRLGSEWLSINEIGNDAIDDIIDDEYTELVADTKVLEEELTINGDGTNNYIKLNEDIMFVKRVRFGYVSASDEGDVVEQISPLEFYGDFTGGNPEYYWIQGMGKYDSQYIFFNQIPAAASNIRIYYSKWIDTTASPLEIKELWGKALKHIVVANVCLMGRNLEQVKMRQPLHDFEVEQYNKTMKKIRQIPKFSNTTTQFTDV